MTTPNTNVTVEQVQRVKKAFDEYDIAAIEDCFAEDAEFRNATGKDGFGTVHKGRAAIKAYFESVFKQTPDVRWTHSEEYFCGDRFICAWHRTATLPTGEISEWLGSDIYTFRDGKITAKDTYIKVAL